VKGSISSRPYLVQQIDVSRAFIHHTCGAEVGKVTAFIKPSRIIGLGRHATERVVWVCAPESGTRTAPDKVHNKVEKASYPEEQLLVPQIPRFCEIQTLIRSYDL
jgi:hypothetical protein